MSGQHAFLAPSSAARWVACPGSATMAALYPEDEESPEAMEGTAAHWAASETLEGRVVDVGQVAPNGIVLTEEMIEGADMYADAVKGAHLNVAFDLHVEQRVAIPYVHEQNWGTPDAWSFEHYPSTGRATLFVGDYKYGHEFVEVFENWQLIEYACGILDQLAVNGAADQYIDVIFQIVQPRSYHKDDPVREWRCGAADLRPLFNKLQAAAAEATGPDPQCHVNAECKHCPGRHACEAVQRSALGAADMATAAIPIELPPEALGLELRMLQRAKSMLDARVSGLEEAVLGHIKRGASVPHWATEQGVGRRAWNRPITEIIELGLLLGQDLYKPAAITPTQAQKLGMDASIVDAYSTVPAGSVKLVPVNTLNARKVFGK